MTEVPHRGGRSLSDETTARLASWFDGAGIVAPSINYAVFDRSGVLFHHGIGWFDGEHGTPGLDTVYRICSMSKSFCAATVLQLREAGRLSLDDPLDRYLPGFRYPREPGGADVPVTIGMLLSNCSGLPEDNAWADHHLDLPRDELLEILDNLAYSDLPGVSYQYSNLGFAILGLIVEEVTDQPYTDYVDSALLAPLGLSSTRFSASDYEAPDSTPEIAAGYESVDAGETWIERPFIGTGAFACAGAMFSTLRDVATWCAWLAAAFDPDHQEDRVLSRSSRRMMQRILTATPDLDRATHPEVTCSGYGLGLSIEYDERFGVLAHHSGGLPGFSTNMRWHCSSGLGVAVFTNTHGHPAGQWAASLLRIVLEDLAPPARVVRLWSATVSAARAVDAMVRGSGRVEDVSTLLSPNVFSDVEATVRDERTAKAVGSVGGIDDAQAPFSTRLRGAASAAQVSWTVSGRDGELECRIELTPTVPSLVQRLEVVARISAPSQEPSTRVPSLGISVP